MSEEKISADIQGEMFGDKTAHIKYESPEGKKLDISFHWHTKQIGSGGYFSMDENYLETKVSERGLIKSKEIFSDKRKVGEDVWIARPAGGGGKAGGIQSFDQFLKSKDVFDHVADENLRAVLYKAQDAAREAMHDYYEKYHDNKYNQNKLSDVRKKIAKLADKATEITGTEKIVQKFTDSKKIADVEISAKKKAFEKKISDKLFGKVKE